MRRSLQPLVAFGEQAELVVGAIDEAVVGDGDDRGGDGQGVQITLADHLQHMLELGLDTGRQASGRRGLPVRLLAPHAGLCALHGGGLNQTGLTSR